MSDLLSFPKNTYQSWLWLLMLSFSYERPIFIISSMDRVNPRLFDIVLILGVLLFSISKTRAQKNPAFFLWALLVSWFAFCTVLAALFFDFPEKIVLYMFFFLFGYLKGLLAIYLVLKIPKDKVSLNDFVAPMIYGGVFVATYCVYEMFFGVDQVVLTDTLIISKPESMVWGPFSGTYFHIAVYIPLVASIVFSKFLIAKDKRKVFWLFLTCYVSWPVFFSGSRTGVALLFLSFFLVFWYTNKNKKNVLFVFIAAILSSFLIQKYVATNDNYTYQRTVSMSDNHEHNSVINRVFLFTKFNINEYDKSDWVPFIGGGFYVAPVNGEKFRIGYGFHNIYIFAFEQSGLLGFLLFLSFIVFCVRYLRQFLLKDKEIEDNGRWLVTASYAYFVACLVVGVSGHSFWYGFNTGEFQTLRVLVLVVSVAYIKDCRDTHKKHTGNVSCKKKLF